MNGFSTVFNPDHAIRIRLTSPWLAKLTFSQSLGIDIPSSELRMRITHSRYKQLFSNLQLQSRVGACRLPDHRSEPQPVVSQ